MCLLENVVVSESQVLGGVNAGQAIAAETMAAAAIAQAAQAVGITQKACRTRRRLRQAEGTVWETIASFQAVSQMLAEAAVNCHVARLAVYNAASLVEQGSLLRSRPL